MTQDANDKLLERVLQEYKILAEYERLQSEDLGGIYVTPSYESPSLWFGVIFVRSGMYKDGVFRFTLTFPNQFPYDDDVPVVTFQSEVLHPMINPSDGVLNLSHAFPKWQLGKSHVWQMLKFVQFILQNLEDYTIQSEHVVNDEAYQLLMEDHAKFLRRVELCVNESQQKLYETPSQPDQFYICFDRFNPDIHGPVLKSMKENKPTEVTTPPSSGLSWVRKGFYQPLSK